MQRLPGRLPRSFYAGACANARLFNDLLRKGLAHQEAHEDTKKVKGGPTTENTEITEKDIVVAWVHLDLPSTGIFTCRVRSC